MGEQTLGDYFEFDETDLAANRNGRLSEKQRQTLIQEKKSAKRGGIGCGLGFFVIAAIFPAITIPVVIKILIPGHEMGASIGFLVGSAFWMLVWGGIGVSQIYSGIKNSDSKVELKQVTGPINIVGVERRTGGEHPHTYIAHEFHIGDEEFDADDDLPGMMMQGDTYAVYFIEGCKILSLEWLAKA